MDTYGWFVHRTTNHKFWKPFEGIYGLFWQIFWPKVIIWQFFWPKVIKNLAKSDYIDYLLNDRDHFSSWQFWCLQNTPTRPWGNMHAWCSFLNPWSCIMVCKYASKWQATSKLFINVWGITSCLWYSCCIMFGFRDCEFAHSSLYFATQWHSLINLRNVLGV